MSTVTYFLLELVSHPTSENSSPVSFDVSLGGKVEMGRTAEKDSPFHDHFCSSCEQIRLLSEKKIGVGAEDGFVADSWMRSPLKRTKFPSRMAVNFQSLVG